VAENVWFIETKLDQGCFSKFFFWSLGAVV